MMLNRDPCEVLASLWRDLRSKGRWVEGLGVAVRGTPLESEYEQKLQSGGFRLPSLMIEFKPNTIYAWMDKSGNYIQRLMFVTQNDAYDWRRYDPQRLSKSAAREWLEELGLSNFRGAWMQWPMGSNKLLHYISEVNMNTGELECHFEEPNIAYNWWDPEDSVYKCNWNAWSKNTRRVAWGTINLHQIPCLNFPNGPF